MTLSRETLSVNGLILMLLVAIVANTKWCVKPEKSLKPWHMGTHLRVFSESYLMNTNKTGFRWISKIFMSLCFGRKWSQHWEVYILVKDTGVFLKCFYHLPSPVDIDQRKDEHMFTYSNNVNHVSIRFLYGFDIKDLRNFHKGKFMR